MRTKISLKKLKDRSATFGAWTLFSHIFTTNRDRELFKSSKKAESLLCVRFLKISGTLDLKFFIVTSQLGEVKGFLGAVIRAGKKFKWQFTCFFK